MHETPLVSHGGDRSTRRALAAQSVENKTGWRRLIDEPWVRAVIGLPLGDGRAAELGVSSRLTRAGLPECARVSERKRRDCVASGLRGIAHSAVLRRNTGGAAPSPAGAGEGPGRCRRLDEAAQDELTRVAEPDQLAVKQIGGALPLAAEAATRRPTLRLLVSDRPGPPGPPLRPPESPPVTGSGAAAPTYLVGAVPMHHSGSPGRLLPSRVRRRPSAVARRIGR